MLRDRNALYRVLDDGRIENVYTVKILNKSERAHEYSISVSGAGDLSLDPAAPRYQVASGSVYPAILRVRRPAWSPAGSETIRFEIVASDAPKIRATHAARFLAPVQ